MTLETPSVFSPEDLRKNFERLQSNLNIVQNELDQALVVWRSILSSEKQEFKKILEDREQQWQREESMWQKDRESYEQKIRELESFFQKQLTTTEKNAIRALTELDAAWQAERQRWQQTLAQSSTESRQSNELQSVSQQQLELRVAQLTDENAQLLARQAETHQAYSGQEEQWSQKNAELEAQLKEWEEEKVSWQQSFSEKSQEVVQLLESWREERAEKDQLIHSLQYDLGLMEKNLQEVDEIQTNQQNNLTAYVQTLETQVTSLQEFILQTVVVSPQRRKSDISAGDAPPSNVLWPPPPRAAR